MTNARTAKSTREKAAELRAAQEAAERRSRNRLIVGSIVALVAVLIGGFVLVKTAADDADAKRAALQAPPANLYEGGILYGNSTAPVTLEMWEDFQCPACKSGEEQNGTQIDQWVKDGTVKVIYRPVSILDRYSSTEYSTRSAAAAAAVINLKPAAFTAFHKLLFENQPPENGAGLSDDQLIAFAEQAGVDRAAVEPLIREGTFRGWVSTVTEDFSKKGYTGTPTYVVNGNQLKSYDPETLKSAVLTAVK